jgi:hypothetical protein
MKRVLEVGTPWPNANKKISLEITKSSEIYT